MSLAGLISGALFVSCCCPAFAADTYGPPPKEETEVEIIKVEVYEVPWIGDQEQQSPQNSYGPPAPPSYGPPAPEYGPPAPEYGAPAADPQTTTDYPSITTTDLPPPAAINSTNATLASNNSTRNRQTAKLREFSSGQVSRGHYYIYHPTGVLQKVTYLTRDDANKMEFAAQLKYSNVDPVRGPIYTYDPDSYVFSRINRK